MPAESMSRQSAFFAHDFSSNALYLPGVGPALALSARKGQLIWAKRLLAASAAPLLGRLLIPRRPFGEPFRHSFRCVDRLSRRRGLGRPLQQPIGDGSLPEEGRSRCENAERREERLHAASLGWLTTKPPDGQGTTESAERPALFRGSSAAGRRAMPSSVASRSPRPETRYSLPPPGPFRPKRPRISKNCFKRFREKVLCSSVDCSLGRGGPRRVVRNLQPLPLLLISPRYPSEGRRPDRPYAE